MDKNTEKAHFLKQLELYSNSIIGFVVFQGLFYCYQFGTNELFSDAIKSNLELSIGLVIALSITMILGFMANYMIGKKLRSMVQPENSDLVKKIYRGKLVAIILFGMLPVLVTLYFGIIEVNLLM